MSLQHSIRLRATSACDVGATEFANSNLSPGGLEYFTLSVDAIAQEIMYRNVDLDSMEMFLTAGVGDLSFQLSDSALNRIAVRVGQLKG